VVGTSTLGNLALREGARPRANAEHRARRRPNEERDDRTSRRSTDAAMELLRAVGDVAFLFYTATVRCAVVARKSPLGTTMSDAVSHVLAIRRFGIRRSFGQTYLAELHDLLDI